MILAALLAAGLTAAPPDAPPAGSDGGAAAAVSPPAAAAVAAPASGQVTQPAPSVDSHVRYDPGLAVWLEGISRAYEQLSGADAELGVGVGYSWDLINLGVQLDRSLADVAGHHPDYLKAAADFAFITYGGLSFMGRVGLAVVLDAPSCQLAPLNAFGDDCVVPNPGPMWGPEIGWGARYRWTPNYDVYLNANADIETAYNGPRAFFFNPGVVLGLVWHPLGKGK